MATESNYGGKEANKPAAAPERKRQIAVEIAHDGRCDSRYTCQATTGVWQPTSGVQKSEPVVLQRSGAGAGPMTVKEYKEKYWKSQDWSQSNADLARRTGYSLAAIAKWRQRMTGVEPLTAKPKFWKVQDWSKSDADLVLMTGHCQATVAYWRRRIKAPRSRKTGPRQRERMRRLRQEWASWDWTLQDAVLAREHGRSRESVRKIRKIIGQPESPFKWRRRSRFESVKLNSPKFTNLTCREIARKCQCSTATIRELARKQGFQFRPRLSAWQHMNWRLPNCDLAAIWGKRVGLVSQMRYRKQHGPASQGESETYRREIEEEKAKAKSFRQRQ